MPVAVTEILAEDIAERISTDIVADIIQTITTWYDYSTNH